MGTAAVALRLPGTRGVATRTDAACGLGFHQLDGPLVTVCGLAGGVGTSTLAYALARQAAEESSVPVLLVDAAAPTGGLSRAVGAHSPVSLWRLATRLADDAEDAPSFAEFMSGLRLIAAAPGDPGGGTGVDVRPVLDHARRAHGLVVIDAGTRWLTDTMLLAETDAVVWTMPATAAGVDAAQAIFASPLIRSASRRTEILVAREFSSAARPRLRTLRSLADARCDRLVLLPEGGGDSEAFADPVAGIARSLHWSQA